MNILDIMAKEKKLKKIAKIRKSTLQPEQPNVTKQNILSIDQLWGVSIKKYKFDNIEQYESFLKESTLFDLEKHANEYDISPDVPRDIMTDQLVRLFKIDLMNKRGKLDEIKQISPELNKELIRIANS